MTNEGAYHNGYDLAGNLVAESDPLGRVTSRSYNARGQETSVTLPDPDGVGPLAAPVFTKAFNARGELASQTDAMGNITSWAYNAQGQPLTQSDPDPDGAGPLPIAVTTFTYDLAGRRTAVTDASGNTTSYGYDHVGRLVEEIDPRGNSSYYQYDAAGQVTRVVDRNSRKREFSYNDLGLVTSEVWIDGFGNAVKTIVHGYDDAGRETSISDGVTGYHYQYDLADRVTYTDNIGSVDIPQVQLYSRYDYEGNRVWLSDSQGGQVWYAWNNQRLQSMALYTENNKSAQVGFGYDTVGRLASMTRTANWDTFTTINTSYTLDLLDRVTSITHSKGMGEDASTLSAFSYGYDANGRVTNYTGSEGSLSFALDANGQLLSVTGSSTENYAFDANGNRTSNSTGTGNLLLNDGQYSYTYDPEGNQKTKTRISDGQVTEFFWDHRNQLTKAMVKDANGVLLKELRFTYDVEGRRVGSWVDADGAGPEEPDQVWTVFDGVNPYMDFDGDGLLKTRYLYGPGIDELFARIGSGEDPEWYLVDRLGSVRQIVDASGAVLDDITYDSFGNVLSETNPEQGDRFKFTGREFSPELGIYYYRARWYDPSSGRFISQDPIGFSAGDVNLYRYVGNAPGDGTDPSGLQNYNINTYGYHFLNTLQESLKTLLKDDMGSWNVHHLYGHRNDGLTKSFYGMFQINLHDPKYLYLVPKFVHTNITTEMNAWWRAQAAGKDCSEAALYKDPKVLKAFKWKSENLEKKYKDYMIPFNGSDKDLINIRRSLGLPISKGKLNSTIFNGQNRWQELRPKFSLLLPVFGYLSGAANAADIVGNITNPTPEAIDAFNGFFNAYETALTSGQDLGDLGSPGRQNISALFLRYLETIGVDQNARSLIGKRLYQYPF